MVGTVVRRAPKRGRKNGGKKLFSPVASRFSHPAISPTGNGVDDDDDEDCGSGKKRVSRGEDDDGDDASGGRKKGGGDLSECWLK